MNRIDQDVTIPEGFRFRKAFLHGRPQHAEFDDFSLRHPKMPHGKRAKIFAPFDALRGFGEVLAAEELAAMGDPCAAQEDEISP